MRHVWLLVFISMVITFGASWFWHMSGMRAEEDRNKIENDAVIASIEQITLYRDAYLSTSTPIYGN